MDLTISTIFNAKIAQAISLCENDKVTFDKNLKVYHCKQESKVFMNNLLPEEKCTCIASDSNNLSILSGNKIQGSCKSFFLKYIFSSYVL